MRKLVLILQLLGACLPAFAALGCAGAGGLAENIVKQPYEPRPAPAEIPLVPEIESLRGKPSPPTDGSIWSADLSVNPFADDKAFHRGDIVLVRVVEKSQGTKKANTGTKRNSSISAKIKYALGWETAINNLTNYTNRVTTQASTGGTSGTATQSSTTNGPWEPNDLINATSSSEFKGEGTTERADVLQATVSALVTDVLANGNLMIFGRQNVRLNNESSVLTVRGIIRPSDIGVDNMIDSSRIANSDIQFTGSGVITDKQHPGWAIRVFDWVWPF